MQLNNPLANAIARSNANQPAKEPPKPSSEDLLKAAQLAQALEAERTRILDALKLKKAVDAATPEEKKEVTDAASKIAVTLASGAASQGGLDKANAEIKSLDIRIGAIQTAATQREQQRTQILDALKLKKAVDAATPEEKKEVTDAASKIAVTLASGAASQGGLDKANAEIKGLDIRIGAIQTAATQREQQRTAILTALTTDAKACPANATTAERQAIDALRAKLNQDLSVAASPEVLSAAQLDVAQLDTLIKTAQDGVTRRKGLVDGFKTRLEPIRLAVQAVNDPNVVLPARIQPILAHLQELDALMVAGLSDETELEKIKQKGPALNTEVGALKTEIARRKDLVTKYKTNLKPVLADVQVLNDPNVLLPAQVKPVVDQLAEIDNLLVVGLKDDVELKKIETKGPALNQAVAALKTLVANAKKNPNAVKMAKYDTRMLWPTEKKRIEDLIPKYLRTKLSKVASDELASFFKQLLEADEIAFNAAVDGAQTALVLPPLVPTWITDKRADREQQWQDKAFAVFATDKGTGAQAATSGGLTTTKFWKFVGNWNIPGSQYVFFKQVKAAGPRRLEIHVTVSGDSVRDLAALAGTNPTLFEQRPSAIFQAVFITNVNRTSRVHATSGDRTGGDHIYLGDTVADTEYGGDAKIMNAYLAEFRDKVLDKIVEAKSLGWKLG